MLWNEEDIRRFGSEVADLIARYYASLETVPITPRDDPQRDASFAGPIPEEGTDPFRLLAEVRQRVLPASFHLPSPRYFGLFNPTPTVIGVFADAISSTINQNMAAWSHGPAGTQIETTVIRWLCDLVGYPPAAFGTLTSGGSVANLTGLKVALNETIPGIRRGGVRAAAGRPVFYVSSEAHYSLVKAADMLGIGLEGMRAVEARGARLDPDRLVAAVAADRAEGLVPFCVVGIAGTTTSGAIDPLAELADLCEREKLWFHVDAAWGGAARLSSRHRRILDGIERAGSITLDPHKWFSVPFSAGAIVTRDGKALRRGFEVRPHYVSDRAFVEHEDLNLFQYGIAGSRRFDALKVWLSLRQHGRRGYEEAVDRQIALAEQLARRVSGAPDMEAVTEPSLGVLCFRYLPPGLEGGPEAIDALQLEVQDRIHRRGKVWISTSVLDRRRVIRFCATSYLTRERHLDDLLAEIRAAAAGAGG